MVKRPDRISHRTIDAAFALAAEKGWRRVSLGDIAERASVTLAELAEEFPAKGAILAGFTRLIDERVLEDLGEASEGESPRDRLFAVMMKRFDALAPYKAGIRAIARAPDSDFAAVAAQACRYIASMGLMLEAAGVSTAGWRGRLRVQGLAALYPCVLSVWLDEEAEDMPRTMAALDRWLRRAEAIDQNLCPRWITEPRPDAGGTRPPRRRRPRPDASDIPAPG